MYQVLTLLTGVTLAVMIPINGDLTAQYGLFHAAAIVHIVGSVFALLLCILKKENKPLWGHEPIWIYLGGAIVVATTVFLNFAFGHISVTSIVALELLGQTVTALIIDYFSLFGMQQKPFRGGVLLGLAFAGLGILQILDTTDVEAALSVGVAFGSGVSLMLARIVNARLANKTGPLGCSLVNYLVGLPFAVAIALVFTKEGMPLTAAPDRGFHVWIYMGGVFGVVVVLLGNMTGFSISSFRLAMLTLIGQVSTAITLDIWNNNGFSGVSLSGGVAIVMGLAINMITEKIAMAKECKHLEQLARTGKIEDEYHKYLFEKYYKQS